VSDKSGIQWTDRTPIVDRGGRRTRFYVRLTPGTPGRRERRLKRSEGFAWCKRCENWCAMAEFSKAHSGLCRTHANEAYREHYAGVGGSAIRARVYARKRGIDVLPPIAREYLLAQFDGACAYCVTEPATTFDHIIPVARGGQTVPGNIVPACGSCNSSKRQRDVFEWAASKGLTLSHDFFDVYSLLLMIGAAA